MNTINKQGESQGKGVTKGKKMGRVRDPKKRVTWTPPENLRLQDGVQRQQTGRLTKMLASGRSKRGKPYHQVTTTPTTIQNLVSEAPIPIMRWTALIVHSRKPAQWR